jgi:hypothetical protein
MRTKTSTIQTSDTLSKPSHDQRCSAIKANAQTNVNDTNETNTLFNTRRESHMRGQGVDERDTRLARAPRATRAYKQNDTLSKPKSLESDARPAADTQDARPGTMRAYKRTIREPKRAAKIRRGTDACTARAGLLLHTVRKTRLSGVLSLGRTPAKAKARTTP